MIASSTTRSIVAVLALCVSLMALTAEAAIVPRLENRENLVITAIGTSLTAPGSTWFPRMGTWLATKYPDQVTTYNEAIGSSASKYTGTYTSPGSGLDVQLNNALAHNPDAIFIEFAINDAYTPYSITPEMSKANLQEMITRINSYAATNKKQVDIVVQTMNNCINEHATARPNLDTYYRGYREVVGNNNGVLLIDHYKNWADLYNTDPDTWHLYVGDHIHPNDLGAEKIIVPEIQRVLLAQVPEPQAMVLSITAVFGWIVYVWRKRR